MKYLNIKNAIGVLLSLIPLFTKAQISDAIYPIPTNYGNEMAGDVDLFEGIVKKKISIFTLEGANLSYDLQAMYNSSSANIINGDTSKFSSNTLGGYGWKLMQYPKIVQDQSGYHLVDGEQAYPLEAISGSSFTIGGEKYIWQINVVNGKWRVSDGNGKHYNFLEAAFTIDGVSVWNFNSIVDYRKLDSLTFSYTKTGDIYQMNNLFGDTATFSYTNDGVASAPLMSELNHTKNGKQIAKMTYGYEPFISPNGTSYPLLSEIEHNHQISGSHYSQKDASTKFRYNEIGSTPPLGGDSYPGAIRSYTTPAGAATTFSYKASNLASITTFRVMQFAVNDGYNNNSGGVFDPNTYTAISYDTTNVLAGASGVYNHYNQVSVAPGGRFDAQVDSLRHPYGNVEYYFLNGQPASSLLDLPSNYPAAAIVSDVLKSQLYQKKINSDSTVSEAAEEKVSIVNYWDVGYLLSDTIGAFPKLLRTYDEKHGVGKWMTYTYGTPYQLPVSIAWTRRNPDPNTSILNKDSVVKKMTYAFQEYSGLASTGTYLINKLSKQITLVQEDQQGNFEVIDCDCTQWSQWLEDGTSGSTGYWAPSRYTKMRSASADTATCKAVTKTSNDWLVVGAINMRNQLGQTLDSTTVANGTISSIFSNPSFGAMPVAVFEQANSYTTSTPHTANADYLGFEEYERIYTNWVTSNGRINTDYAHTGDKSYTGSLSRQFTSPRDLAHFYVINVWVGMREIGDSYSIVLKDGNGGIISSDSASWVSGDPTIQYVEISGFVPTSQSFTVSLSARGNAFLDDIVVMPADANFQANVYAIDRNIPESQLGLSGATTHLVHNRFNSLIAKVGPGSIQNINDLSIPYNSRRGSRFFFGVDTFNTIYPNMTLFASAKSGGNWQGFQYTSNGSFPPQNLSGMTIEDDWLVATTASASAIFSHNVDTANMALYTEIFPNQLSAQEEIGFSLQLDSLASDGTVISSKEIKFVLTADSLKLYSGAQVYESIPVSEILNSTSLLFSLSNYNYFYGYVNGRYVFEHEFEQSKINGPAKLITSNVGAAFDNFIFVATPSVYQKTYDALLRPRQQISQHNLNELKVKEILYGGPLNLPVAVSRSAIVGGQDDDTGLSFKPNLNKGFNYESMSISDSSTLGNASNYNNPFSTSISYSKSPLLQLESIGGGGQFTVGESGDHFNQFDYGEDAGTIFNYRTDQLLVTIQTEPNGVKNFTFSNREEVVFAEARIKSGDTIKTQYEFDNKMRLLKTYHPNYYDKSTASNTNFTLSYEYDFIGNQIKVTSPDAGSSYFVYDPSSKLRFKIDSVGLSANTDQIIYYKYDGLNRLEEEGILNMDWNRVALQAYADSVPSFPSGGANYIPRKTYTYDGKGLKYDQGKLISVQLNWDEGGDYEVSETYQYDEFGNVVEKVIYSSDFGGAQQLVQYEYDLENRVTLTRLPNTSHPGIVYTYGDDNKISAIGIPGDLDYYASYEYEYATIEYLNNRSFMRKYYYNEAGWPTAINDPLWSESLSYEQASEDSYDYNGKIAALDNRLKWSGDSLVATFQYDHNARITKADYGSNNKWSLGLSNPVSYDDNGNILSLQYGSSAPIAYSYSEGTNRVSSRSANQFSYNGNGALSSEQGGTSSLTYDPVSHLTLTATYDGTSTGYHYDGQNKRVLKQVAYASGKEAKRLYVHGLSDVPLMELYTDSTGTTTTTIYIHGPKGLIAIQQEEERLFVLKDHLGSVRVVMDTTNAVKAYFNYSAFGNEIVSFIDHSISHFSLNYRYTSQEIELELGGVYNYRSRLYDPEVGRFYSPDPKRQYASPYEYVGNNPINYTDPSGEWSWGGVFAGVAVAVVTAVVVAAVVTVAVAAAPITLPAAIGGTAIVTAVGGAGAIGTAVLVTQGAIAIGVGVGAAVGIAAGYLTEQAIDKGSPEPTPIIATDDGISAPVKVTQTELGISGKTVWGYYSVVNLKKADVVVPDNSKNPKNCLTENGCFDGADPENAPFLRFPFRTLKNNERIRPSKGIYYPGWSEIYDVTLSTNANFWDIEHAVPNTFKCTNLQGLSVGNGVFVSDSLKYGAWTGGGHGTGGLKYNLDALIFYKENVAQSTRVYAEMIPYSEVPLLPLRNSNQQQLRDKIQNAVGGFYYVRNGVNVSDTISGNVMRKDDAIGRTVIGLDSTKSKLLVLQVNGEIPTSAGITVNDVVNWFKKNGYKDVLALDGSGSSAFLYEDNGQTFQSAPMDSFNLCIDHSSGYYYRPSPNFLGFKKRN